MIQIDGHEIEFGRVPSPPDARDALFPFALALPPADAALPVAKDWELPPVSKRLDQNGWPRCTCYAWRHWGMTAPVETPYTNEDADELYAECKAIDGYAGDGTWVRVALSILKDEGHIGRYLWAQSLDDIRRWVLLNGPVVVGTPWYAGMSTPGAGALMRPTGALQGGHAWLITGYDSRTRRFAMLNSWGAWWGSNGTAYIGEDDLWSLFAGGQSEAAAAEEVEAIVSNDGIGPDGFFRWAVRKPGPADRAAFYHTTTAMNAVFHHDREGAGDAYDVLTDPARYPTGYHWQVRYDGTLDQHYDVRLALVASNDGNFAGPAGEMEGFANEPANPAQVATWLRIHRDLAAFTGRTPKRVTTPKLSYADLQRIPTGELWLLEHRQVGATSCPSERYAPLWAALVEEDDDMSLAEDLATLLLDGFHLTITEGNLEAARKALGQEVGVGSSFILNRDQCLIFAKAQGMRFFEGLRLTQRAVADLAATTSASSDHLDAALSMHGGNE